MTRIFSSLAFFSLLMMGAALVLGLSIGDLYNPQDEAARRMAVMHRLTGLAAALAVVLVNSIVITYFVGTSRWVKEVAEAYGLDRQLIAESTRIKRRTFPWALGAMLTVVGVIALGGASDPGTGRSGTQDWAIYHLLGAMAGMALIVACYFIQWNNIRANYTVIDRVMAEVRKIREQRGLDAGDSLDT